MFSPHPLTEKHWKVILHTIIAYVYISHGEILDLLTAFKDCLWPEDESWFCPKDIWATSRSLEGKWQNSCPVDDLYWFEVQKVNFISIYTNLNVYCPYLRLVYPIIYVQGWGHKCFTNISCLKIFFTSGHSRDKLSTWSWWTRTFIPKLWKLMVSGFWC